MACIITLKVKGLTFLYTTSLNPEEITLENIAKELATKEITYSSGKKQGLTNLSEALASSLSLDKSLTASTKGVKAIIKAALEGESGSIVGNYTLNALAGRFSNLAFGNGKLKQNEEILYTQNLSYEGIGLGGKVTIGDKAVYIITNEYDARKFANYLSLRDKLEKETIDFKALSLSNALEKALKYILKESGIKDLQKALYHFFNNSDKYLTSVSDNVDIYTELSNLIKEKLNDKYVRRTLENPIANSIIQRARWIDNSYYLSTTQLKNIIDMFKVETDLKLGKKTKSYTPSTDSEIKTWLENFMSDAGNPVKVSITKHGFIRIQTPYKTFKDLDFTYEDVELAVQQSAENYGFKVYKIKNKYYVSQDKIITLDTHAQEFSSMSDALTYIRNRIERTPVGSGFRRAKLTIPFDINGVSTIQVPSSFNPAENTVFEALNYPIDSSEKLSSLIESEHYLPLLGMNMNDFKNGIIELLGFDSENDLSETESDLLDSIDSYEKATALLIEASKRKYTKANLHKALVTISNLETGRFLVINNGKAYDNTHKLVIQRVDNILESTEEESKYVPPVIVPLKNLAENINKKFKALNKTDEDLVYIITNSDITSGNYGLDLFKNVDSSAAGFIFNGKIYINASYAHYDDLAHEFGHLWLGMMKAADLELYTKMMHKLSEMPKVLEMKQKKSMMTQYSSLADEDLTEEAFVDLFGQFLKRNNKDLAFLNEAKKAANMSLAKFGTFLDGVFTLEDIFNNFNTVTKDYLFQGNGMEFSTAAAQQRRVTNFIKSELAKGADSKIIMTC